ncbi:hypothetical protein EVAR_84845_1 [Eumeta japonica]|uniref:Uncharacterized protein n=1 Tax=Eumeta variegata TaxID=151549 RepID=A0A4C1U8A2_EUMVA|nr:hypothetical protein EVAR_84845_1 [Eumeta japonica]
MYMVELKGIIHHNHLPPSKTINSDLYCQQLMRLKDTASAGEGMRCDESTAPATTGWGRRRCPRRHATVRCDPSVRHRPRRRTIMTSRCISNALRLSAQVPRQRNPKLILRNELNFFSCPRTVVICPIIFHKNIQENVIIVAHCLRTPTAVVVAGGAFVSGRPINRCGIGDAITGVSPARGGRLFMTGARRRGPPRQQKADK